MTHPSFKIFDASAGSGKTYTLTREYLKIILASPKGFTRILAITFTNKAVNEMKQRILDNLFQFGQTRTIAQASPLFLDMMDYLRLNSEDLRERAETTLKNILHNYAFFDISTIDRFTHRLIRTFARDLRLPRNFDVVLDNDLLLDEAVARLINKAGESEKLTRILIAFALEKVANDKSWDVAYDLKKIGKLLFDETHKTHLKKLEKKELGDFSAFQKHLQQKIKVFGEKAVSLSTKTLQLIDDSGLSYLDFPRATLPDHFKKISASEFNTGKLYKNSLEKQLLEGNILKSGIEPPPPELTTGLLRYYLDIKKVLFERAFLINVYGNVIPLTLLNSLRQELRQIQEERDLLPISEFNTLISEEIKNQPAPFIYERLGEKYRHYFIDEFQDTSQMQWDNLIPLIDNALAGENGSLFLVGDAKQAIYRWRGGRAEQFLNLVNLNTNPFVTSPQTESLPKNYRSFEALVTFNNTFFKSAGKSLGNPTYRELYEKGSHQSPNAQKGGLASLAFLNKKGTADLDALYCNKVLEYILEIIAHGYSYGNVCILTRKKKHGILLADFLLEKNIPIVSSETLLVAHSPKVGFLIALLEYAVQPGTRELAYPILLFLADDSLEKHTFLTGHLAGLSKLLRSQYDFDLELFGRLAVYDGLEYAVRQFELAQSSDAYITALLDFALETSQKEGAGISSFLTHWEKNMEKLSLVAPTNFNAVQLMTVHKAKGLEFPIVIFPYANTYVYEEMDPKLWLPVEVDTFNGFTEVLINKKTEVSQYGKIPAQAFLEEQEKLELDAYNILYVALTRAARGLYIISEKEISAKGEHRTDKYSGLFIQYLIEKGMWQEHQKNYTFGELPPPDLAAKTSKEETIAFTYSYKDRGSFRMLARSGMLWDTEREMAMDQGNLIHYILGKIEIATDLDKVLSGLVQNGDIGENQLLVIRERVTKVIHHPKLKQYFSAGNKILNEQDIILPNGKVLRPDRIVLGRSWATILDYKTGIPNANHHKQVYAYAAALEDMGHYIKDKIIVYIKDKEVTLEYV
ncbi:MAG: UvrD-helicase domain-containing protein [Bacteroidota bacterium]